MANEALVGWRNLHGVLGWLECVVELADGGACHGVDVACFGVVRCFGDRPGGSLDRFFAAADR